MLRQKRSRASRRVHWLQTVAVLMLVGLLMAACGGGTSGSGPADQPAGSSAPSDDSDEAVEPKVGGTLVIGVATNPRNIDPRLQWDTASQIPLSNVVDRFFTMDEDFNYRPLLAESWEASDDATEFTFHLRPNVKFHDGTEVTAEAIKANILWTAAQEAFPQANFWKGLAGVETPDKYTLVIKWNEPIAPTDFWAERFDTPWPISLAQLEEHGDDPVTHPISAGPFKFVSYTADDQIVLERFDDYWAGAPYLDRVIFRVIPDAATRRVEMEAGTIDILMDVEPKDVESYLSRGLRLIRGPSPTSNMISLNLASEPLQDLRVRLAIAHAIDRDTLIDRVFYGYVTKATTYLHPNNIYFADDIPGFEYDPARSEQLLDEAGWVKGPDGIRTKDGQRLHLTIASRDHDTWVLMSQVLADHLRRIGIDTTIKTTDTTAFYDAVRAGDYDLAYWVLQGSGWSILGHPNLHSTDWGNISHMTKSSAEVQALQQEIDRIIEGFGRGLDEETRRSFARELQQVINENVVTVPLWFEDRLYIMKPDVKGVEAPTVMRSLRLEKAWLDR